MRMWCLLALLGSFGSAQSSTTEWTLVVDAGSSGTRMHMFYNEPVQSVDQIPRILEYIPTQKADEDLLKISPGISSYAQDPAGVVDGVNGLLAQAQRWVPSTTWASTDIFMFATAGMRLLDPTIEAAIWSQIRTVLQGSVFRFSDVEQARTITGATEGVYGWLTVNYITGMLDTASTTGEVASTFGAMDLGGASTQLTFNSEVDLMADAFPLEYDRVHFETMFAQTHMRSGLTEALLRLLAALWRQACTSRTGSCTATSVTSPCHRAGAATVADVSSYGAPDNLTVVGSGNFSSCSDLIVAALLHTSWECTQEPCSILGRYQPQLSKAAPKLHAFSGFFYAASGVGLTNSSTVWNGTLDELASKARSFCGLDGSGDTGYTLTDCFSAVYAYTLLVDGYHIPSGAQGAGMVIISEKINNYNVGWALGAVLHQKSGYSVLLQQGENLREQLDSCTGKLTDAEASTSVRSWVWPVVILLALMVAAQSVTIGVMYTKEYHSDMYPSEEDPHGYVAFGTDTEFEEATTRSKRG